MSHQETFLSQCVWRLGGSQNCTAKIGKTRTWKKIVLEGFGQSGNQKYAAVLLTIIYYIRCDEF